jgi:poly-beta-1,6-N-acetyl-D-glucosamine synthase
METYLIILKLTIASCYSNIFNAYILYPLALFIFSRFINKKVDKSSEFKPEIAILISAYNEEELIEDAIRSIYVNDYPLDKIQVIVGSDGSDDRTAEIVTQLLSEYDSLRLFEFPRQGKNQTINALVEKAEAEVIFFMDADLRITKNQIETMVEQFNDDMVGGVMSSLEIIAQDGGDVGELGEKIYQKFEKTIRKWETQISTNINSLGTFYGIKRRYFKEIPNDYVCDDLFIVLQIAAVKKRMIFMDDVKTIEIRKKTLSKEINRRVRLAAGGISTVKAHWHLLLPGYGWASFFLSMHKLMRWLAPIYMLGILIGTFMLPWGDEFQRWMIFFQSILYGSALLGWIFEKIKIKILPFRLAVFFVSMNYAFLLGWYHFLRKGQNAKWDRDSLEKEV